ELFGLLMPVRIELEHKGCRPRVIGELVVARDARIALLQSPDCLIDLPRIDEFVLPNPSSISASVVRYCLLPAKISCLLELRFGNTRLLEVQLIELSLSRLRHQAGRARRTARPEWHAEADDCAACQATVAPQSWPMMTAVGASNLSSSPTRSPT